MRATTNLHPPPLAVRLKVRALSARADPPRWFCGESNTSYDSVNKIITCVHFLLYLNDYECVASEGLRDVQVCRVDDAVITIYDKFNDDESYRRSSWYVPLSVGWRSRWGFEEGCFAD